MPRLLARIHDRLDDLRSRLVCWQFGGQEFHCPLCQRDFRRLLTSRGHYSIRGERLDHTTANSICPGCGSGIRHRFAFSFLQRAINRWPSDMKVLHFGPEPALQRFFRDKVQHYLPCDLDPDRVLGVRKMDIRNIACGTGRFDLVVCIHVLEHIREDRRAIDELYRVLRPGGHALIAVPIYGPVTYEDPTLDFAGRTRMFGIGDHVRLYGLDIEAKLEDAGFHTELQSTDTVPGNYFDRLQDTPHLRSDKYLFWCHKPEVIDPQISQIWKKSVQSVKSVDKKTEVTSVCSSSAP